MKREQIDVWGSCLFSNGQLKVAVLESCILDHLLKGDITNKYLTFLNAVVVFLFFFLACSGGITGVVHSCYFICTLSFADNDNAATDIASLVRQYCLLLLVSNFDECYQQSNIALH